MKLHLKRRWPYRCRECEQRRTLPKAVEEYTRVPKCACGAKNWRLDQYMLKRENKTCSCSGYPFPHRWGGGSCEHNPNAEPYRPAMNWRV